MPRFSICVSTYNDEEFLSSCIESVLSQSFSDFELIVVVDGSPDGSARIAASYTERDSRVVAVIKEENEGLHRGRATGVERASGEYIILLDSDDELLPGALEALDAALFEGPADVLHFGIDVAGVGVPEDTRRAFEDYINAEVEPLEGEDAVRAVFGADGSYRQDWRVTQRVYAASLARRAFMAMERTWLGYAEDAYETLVILSLAKRQVTRNDIVALRYYLGRGINGSSALTCEEFQKRVHGFQDVIEHIERFATTGDASVLAACAEGARGKLLQLLFNDWRDRVADGEKLDAALLAAGVVGGLAVGTELMRCARDAAYAAWDAGRDLAPDAPYLSWYEGAKLLAGNAASSSAEFLAFRDAAKLHIGELRHRTRFAAYERQPVRIFVSTHKRVDLFDSDVLQPVQVGCEGRKKLFDWAFHDNDGQNISAQNPMYCELTTQYWAWKNVDADYIGFCHYRRYFDFNPERHAENEYGEIMDGLIDAASQRRYRLDDASIIDAVRGYDLVTTEVKDIRSFAGPRATTRGHYDAAPKLHVEDLDRVIEIMGRRHPEYLEDAKAFLEGHESCFCNMFIMRRELFDAYCAWLFPILEEFVETTDMSRYSKEGVRTPGHLSERLLNIYLMHHERVGAGWKRKQLQCVHFTEPDYHDEQHMLPATSDLRPVIPVAFASDDAYVPMLTTTVYSALKNASPAYRYDVIVLHRGITKEHRAQVREFLSQFSNATVRFCDVSGIVGRYRLSTNNPHISVETYYRFLIQALLPFYDRVLYLDSDLIVKGDIAELFSVELGDNLLAAVRDIDFLGNLNMKGGERTAYAKDVLGMKDPYTYFQAGVLVLNTAEMRRAHTMDEWLEFASNDRFIYNDQDVLNAHCEGRVVYLDDAWNVMIDCAGRIEHVFSFAPAEVLDAFTAARKDEKIVHYAGFEKPWKMAGCDRAELYWSYARMTPFYERLLAGMAGGGEASPRLVPLHERAVAETSGLRHLVDPFMPIGSARREAAKALVRALRGRS